MKPGVRGLADRHADRCSGKKRQRQVASKARLRNTSNSGSRYEIKVYRTNWLLQMGPAPSVSDVPNSVAR